MIIQNLEQFMLDAYTGKGGFEDGSYLVQYPRETDDKYNRRKQLAYYPNYVKKVIGAYHGHLFRDDAKRESESKAYLAFMDNADGLGSPVQRVIKRAQLLSMLFGYVLLVVDRPRGEARTGADDLALSPYVTVRRPSSVAKAEFDEFGELIHIAFLETRDNSRVYRHFWRDRWAITEDVDGEKVTEQGQYNLRRVPVVPLYSTEPLSAASLDAVPWGLDCAKANFDIFNALSELREILRGQTFSIFTVPVRDASEAERLKDLKISVENALSYNPDGGGRPDFVAPPEGPATLYLKYLETQVSAIYSMANLEFTGGVEQSGIALAFKFQEAQNSLSDLAILCETAEEQVARLVCAWAGEEWDGKIAYPRRFQVTDLLNELKIAMDALTLSISPTFDKSLKKRIAREVLGNWASSETYQAIDDEIENGPGDEYEGRLGAESA